MSTLHIKQLPRAIALSYQAGTNLLLTSKPATGKSETTFKTAQTMAERIEGFGYWPFDVGTANPNDVAAYMPNMETGKLQVFANSVLPNAYDNPDTKGIVFIDEVMNGDPATVKVFQKYINGEDISGKLRKPVGVIIIAASNRMMDKAGAMQQSRAFMSRIEQLEIYSDAGHNLHFMDDDSWWPVLRKFLEKFPDLIDNYETVFNVDEDKKKRTTDEVAEQGEEGKRGVWANMRSWKRISKLEYAAQLLHIPLDACRITSNVGKAVGTQYNTYRAMFDKIASVEEILKDPKGVEIPKKIDELFVMVCMLSQLVKATEMKPAATFVDRLQGDMRALAIRRMVKRSQKNRAEFDIGATKEYHAWMKDPSIQDLFMAAR
jgi:hypothetical protein